MNPSGTARRSSTPTVPNLPAWLAHEDLHSLDFDVAVEAWTPYLPALSGWYGPGFAGAVSLADNGVTGIQRADYALPLTSGFYNPADHGSRWQAGRHHPDSAHPSNPSKTAAPAQRHGENELLDVARM